MGVALAPPTGVPWAMLVVRLQTRLLTRVMTSPDAVAKLLAGPERVVRGQHVPLRTRLLLRTIGLDPRPRYAHSVARQRADFGALTAAASGRRREVEVSDHAGPRGVCVRVYRPRGSRDEVFPR